MFIAPSMTSHEKSSAAQRSRSKMPSAHALRQMALTVRVRAMSALILSPVALAARKVAICGAEMWAKGPPAELVAPERVESIEGGTGRRALMSRSSRWEMTNACKGANASACGTTSGITGTFRLPFERICGCEIGMRGMCAQLAARTMWWVGTRKTESVVGCLEDGLDWTARMCVGGVMPRLGAMSKEDGTRERGSCGGTTAAVIDAMSLSTKKKRGKKKGENTVGQSGFVQRGYVWTYSSPRA
jgi:hypothetical protein